MRRRRLFLGSIAAIIVASIIVQLMGIVSIPSYTAEELRVAVEGYGPWAPVAMVLFQVVHVVVAPIPNQAAAIASGYLFGTWFGILYTTIGTTLGGIIAFFLSRTVGRPIAEMMVSGETLTRADAAASQADVPVLIALFLIPFFPGDAICYAAGLSKIRFRAFVVAAVLGRFPKFVVYTVFGDRFASDGFLPALPYLLPLALVAAAVYWKRDAVRRLVQ